MRHTFLLGLLLLAVGNSALAGTERATLIPSGEFAVKEAALRAANASPPSIASLLAPKAISGVSFSSAGALPAFQIAGSLALVKLGPGTLDLDLGGGFLGTPTMDGAVPSGLLGFSYNWATSPPVGIGVWGNYSRFGWAVLGGFALAAPIFP